MSFDGESGYIRGYNAGLAKAASRQSRSKALLACPFCGSTPEVKHIGNEHVKKQVCEIACTTFGCFAHQRVAILNGRGYTYEWAEQKCRERWNTRHANSARSGK